MIKRNSFVMVAAVGVRAVVGALAGTGLSLLVSALVAKPIPLVIYMVLLIGLAVRLAFVVTEWRTTTYEVLETELIFRTGRVQSSEVHVPWSSVRGFYVEAPWLLRIFGRSELRLSLGVGQSSDVHFKALSPTAISELRHVIDVTSDSSSQAIEFFDDTSGFNDTHVTLYSLAHARWYVITPVLIALLGIVSQFLQSDIIQAAIYVWDFITSLPSRTTALIVTGVVALAVLSGFVVRIIEMANFRVRQTDSSIETRQGLASTKVRTINSSDITLVQVQRPILLRLARGGSVLVSGGSGEGDPPLVLSPFASKEDAVASIRSVFPGYQEGAVLAESKLFGRILAATPWIIGLVAAHITLSTCWSLGALAALMLLVFLWLARTSAQVSLTSGGVVEIQQGMFRRRRFVFRTSSILHHSSVEGLLGRWVPSNKIHLSVADRGTRDITVRAIPFRDLEKMLCALSSDRDVGTYHFSRPHQELINSEDSE